MERKLLLAIPIVIVAILVLLLLLPTNVSDTRPTESVQLTEPHWVLSSLLNNGQTIPLTSPEIVTIQFEEDGSVSGTSTCNLFFGQYTILVEYQISSQEAGGIDEQRGEGGTIVFGSIAQTERACLEPGLMEEESQFLTALGKTTQFQVTADSLKLFDSNEPASVLLNFEILR